jgi:hypothetical protein
MKITNEIREFCESREISYEIGQAIFDIVGAENAAEELENGYESEAVIAAAWDLADDETEELFWGEEVITR